MKNELDLEKEIILKKLKFFKKKKIHVTLKCKKFYNGEVISIHADFFLLREKDGSEQPLFFCEIETIEPYKLKGETNGD